MNPLAENNPLLANDIALRVEDLSAGYGLVPVLDKISLQIPKSHILGVLGHNGMGKSTLLKCLVGLIPIQSGSIWFDGEPFQDFPPYHRAQTGIAFVPQGRGIIAGISTEENLLLAWHASSGWTPTQALEFSLSLFPRLKRLLSRLGGRLSGGEQQLLALARCMMINPWFLLLDEPTEGIQPNIIQEISATLLQLQKNQKISILLVEQNLDFISSCANRVAILEKGRFIANLSPEEMLQQAESLLGLGGRLGTSEFSQVSPPNPSTQRLSAGHPQSPHPAQIPSSHLPPLSPNTLPHPPSSSRLATSSLPSLGHPDLLSSLPVSTMSLRRPTLEQMQSIVASLNMNMSDSEIRQYMQIMEASFTAYDRIDALPDFLPKVQYPRTPGYRPSGSDNPLNAWYVKTEVRGQHSGKLQGKRVVLKDNICLAGVPMMNGSSTLEGFVPDIDATVVTRVLDAGGVIVGKAHCEYFCLSGGSHTNATGPVHNPWRMGYIAGGSSSGCGALVANHEVEMAIGGDQGGSIRIPAAFCGIYGMKPTHGLVPYTGIMPIEATVDHTGPMTATVSDNALLLEVLAGSDGLDPRQYNPKVDAYTQALTQGVAGMRIALVKESLGLPNTHPGIVQKVRLAAERLAKLGAIVEEISLPAHLDGAAIWTPITLEGMQAQMMHGNGMGYNWKGLYTTSLHNRHANWKSRANELSPSLKISMFIGEYGLRFLQGRYYAKAQNLSRWLKAEYDQVLQKYHLLLMPTLPIVAQPIPQPGASLEEIIQRAFEMVGNTAPFDATGHPAMSIPCGLVDGLPAGLMLVGNSYAESTIYRAAYAFEQSGDWRQF